MSNTDNNVNIVQAPGGFQGQGFFATKFDYVIGLARANSLWPLPFATSCCGIEFMATMASTYDMGLFGAERNSTRAADDAQRQQDPSRPVDTVDPRDRSTDPAPPRTLPIPGTNTGPGGLPPQGALPDPYANPR